MQCTNDKYESEHLIQINYLFEIATHIICGTFAEIH